jgi:lauroyl/myristoyl acyltransferase
MASVANPPERNVVVVPASRRSVKQRCGVLAARIVSNVTRVVPLPVGYWLCDQLGDLLFWRSRLYRLNVIDNLRHVYGPELGERELRRHARGVFRTSARNFWDLTRAPHLDEDELRRIIRYPDHALSLLDRLRDEGKGGILITGHLGPFDFVGQALYLGGYNPFILTAPWTATSPTWARR